MSRQLPIPLRNESAGRSLAVPEQRATTQSPLVRLAIALAPDILRAAEQVVLQRAATPARSEPARQTHSHSVQISEVEVDTSLPFVRRVTVRSASSWTSSPVEQPEPAAAPSGLRRTGRWLGFSGAAAVVAALMVRRYMPGSRVIDVEGRARD